MEIRVAELLLQCLKAEGVDAMFGIVDGAHVPFVGLTPRYGIQYVNAHHEESAVHMAEGYTRISKKVSVVIGSPGPGGANMVAGLASAFAEGHPILAITCTRRTITTTPDRGSAWQATNLCDMAKPITKYAAVVTRWERLPEMARAAFRAATTGRPGPSLLAIPDELLGLTIDDSKVHVYPGGRYRVENMGAGDPASIQLAADWLAGANKVYIHAGKGVIWADAAGELLSLVNTLNCGISTSMGARGTVPEDHPNYFHIFDTPAITTLRNEADVVLVVGSRLGEYDAWGMPPLWGDPDTQKTIQIDADPYSIGLNRPVDLAIAADARRALQALLEAVKARTAPRPAMPDLERYRAMSAERRAQLQPYLQTPPKQGVNPAQMVSTVRNFFPRDAITVLDGGNTVLTSLSYYPIMAPNSFIYSVKMGYLGTGLPYAIGAKIADRRRPVCLITGDGAIGFCIMEMETALRLNAPLTVIVAVDQAWGMEKPVFLMRGFTPEQFGSIELCPELRYDLIAQGLGCFGEKVDDISQLPGALERAGKSGKPALIHVSIDPSLNITPPGMDNFRNLRTLTGL